MNKRSKMGSRPSGARQERIAASVQWHGDSFRNVLPDQHPNFFRAAWKFSTAAKGHREPASRAIATVTPTFSATAAQELTTTWFGHSTTMVELDGVRVLFDPVWAKRASPFARVGPARFFDPVIPIAALPKIDVVVISHDHYDHLDDDAVTELAKTQTMFVTAVGVGAHLEAWGIDPQRIIELDWWESHSVGTVKITATPARHFSGRRATGRNRTLWAGWAVAGSSQRLFFSGDTGLFPELSQIGQRLGPFDVTLIESGGYNTMWSDSHLGPEQAVVAHQLVGGKLMIPVHWGMFNLALHSWTEPAERVLAAARSSSVAVAFPRIGESIDARKPPGIERWWPDVPWEKASESLVVASLLPGPLAERVRAFAR